MYPGFTDLWIAISTPRGVALIFGWLVGKFHLLQTFFRKRFQVDKGLKKKTLLARSTDITASMYVDHLP